MSDNPNFPPNPKPVAGGPEDNPEYAFSGFDKVRQAADQAKELPEVQAAITETKGFYEQYKNAIHNALFVGGIYLVSRRIVSKSVTKALSKAVFDVIQIPMSNEDYYKAVADGLPVTQIVFHK